MVELNKEQVNELIEVLKPFCEALKVNDTDTLGMQYPDNIVLFSLSGSWSGSSEVTLGDLRQLIKVMSEHFDLGIETQMMFMMRKEMYGDN